MDLPWPGIANTGGDLKEADRVQIRDLLNRFGHLAEVELAAFGLPHHASPLWRPWNIVVVQDAEKVIAAFSRLEGGIAIERWMDKGGEIIPPADVIAAVRQDLGLTASTVLVLPKPDARDLEAGLMAVARQHATEVERGTRLGRLGDLTGLTHLEPQLRTFLDDHPDPSRNVFIMMRFIETEQMNDIAGTIKATLSERGFHGVRADDRDYTGELWSNIEVYMTCCLLGIAVFEDIEQRDFNPNVSLELGYMLGRRRRCLILKEQRLPNLPADVIHRLYKPFDVFDIQRSVGREVARWVDVDLGVV